MASWGRIHMSVDIVVANSLHHGSYIHGLCMGLKRVALSWRWNLGMYYTGTWTVEDRRAHCRGLNSHESGVSLLKNHLISLL